MELIFIGKPVQPDFMLGDCTTEDMLDCLVVFYLPGWKRTELPPQCIPLEVDRNLLLILEATSGRIPSQDDTPTLGKSSGY